MDKINIVELRKQGCNFFPIDRETGSRIGLELGHQDLTLASGRGSTKVLGTVTDQRSQKRYEICGLGCGLPRCVCDALATVIDHVED